MPAPLAALGGIVARVGGARAATAAARRAARGGARTGARSRLRRMRAKRAAGRFGRTFMSQMFGINFPEAVQGGSTRGGRGGGAGGKGGGESFDINLPPKGSAKTYSKQSNPSLSTLSEQISELVKIAERLGVSSRNQEQALIEGAAQRERASKEATLETDADATMVQGPGVGGESIEAIEPEINKLIEAIRGLSDRIEQGQSGGSGLGGLATAAAAAATVGQGAAAVGRAAVSGARSVGRSAFRLAEKIGIGTTKIQNLGKGSLLKGAALKKKIADIAKPLLVKSLAKTGLKSIPIVGAVAGLGFAIGRLLKGDIVGAGLDAASGLAGPLTAIPALVASLARDVYYGVYGIYPEQDALVGERLPEIKDSIEELAKEQLRDTTDVKEPKAPVPEYRPAPTPTMEASAMDSSPSTSGSGGGTSAAPQTNGGGTTGGGSPAPGSAGEDKASAGQGSSTGGEAPTPVSKDSEAAGISGTAAPGGGSMPPGVTPVPASGMGAAIAAASEEPLTPPPAPTIPGTTISSPSTLPTTKSNATGMGDVPDPSYTSAGDLASSIYFGAVAGAMA